MSNPEGFNEKQSLKKNILRNLNKTKSSRFYANGFQLGSLRCTGLRNPLNVTWDFSKTFGVTKCFSDAEIHRDTFFCTPRRQQFSPAQSAQARLNNWCCHPQLQRDSCYTNAIIIQDIHQKDLPSLLLAAVMNESHSKANRCQAMEKLFVHSRTMQDLWKVADEQHRVIELKRYFSLWMKRTGRSKDGSSSFRASKFNRGLLVSHCFRSWRSYCLQVEDISESNSYLVTKFWVTHGRRRLLYGAFSAWKYCITNRTRAKMWHEKNLLSHVVHRWYRYMIRSRKNHYLQLVASLHFIERERRHRFREWYQIWTEQNDLCLKSKMADHHHNRRLLHQCFHGWHKCLDHAAKLKTLAVENHTNTMRIYLHRILSRWFEYTVRRCTNQQLAVLADQLHRIRLMKLCITKWLLWKRSANARAEIVRRHLVFRKNHKLKMVFLSWLTWAHERCIKRSHAHHAEVLFREKSRILVLRHSLNHWYRSVAMSHKLTLATRHAFLYTISSSFQHWRTWCDVRRKQLQMKIAADRFRTVTLKVMAITTWCQKYKQSVQLKNLDHLALCRWSLCLQARAWAAWRLWIIHRRTKRDLRATLALHVRDYQAKRGFGILIESAMIERNRKQAECCHRFWQSDYRRFNLAVKASTHWRFWTRRRLSRYMSNAAQSAEFEPTQNYCELPTTLFQSNVDDNRDVVSTPQQSHLPKESDIFVKQSLQAFEQEPLWPDFLLPDLQAQGIIPVNAFQKPALHEYSQGESITSQGQLPADGPLPNKKDGESITGILKEVEFLHEKFLRLVLDCKLLKLLLIKQEIFHKTNYNLELTEEQRRDRWEYCRLKRDIRSNRMRCRQMLVKIVRTTTLYIKAKKLCSCYQN